jgi:hypothetical protein
MVSDFAVVGDVAGRHEEAIVTDDGFGTGFGSAVNGGCFAENVAVADFDVAYGTGFNGVVLSDLTYSGKGVEDIVFAEGGVAVDVAM